MAGKIEYIWRRKNRARNKKHIFATAELNTEEEKSTFGDWQLYEYAQVVI